MFTVAKPTKVFQNVVDQIQEAILEGRLKRGQALPPEREMKAMFGISRGTLREALRVLEQKGLIEIRLGVGGGSFVRTVDADQVSESLGLLIRSQKVSLRHLSQFREDIEGIVAGHAARLHAPGDIQRLRHMLDQGQTCVSAGLERRDEFIDIDKRIHMTLAEITANPIYVFVLHSIHDNIQRYYERFLSMEVPELAENQRDLCAVVDAVAAGNAALARKLAQSHVKRFSRYMEQRADQQRK